jgi:hypothetical protein
MNTVIIFETLNNYQLLKMDYAQQRWLIGISYHRENPPRFELVRGVVWHEIISLKITEQKIISSYAAVREPRAASS